MPNIVRSVGAGGANDRADTRMVQRFLNGSGAGLREDGIVGPATVAAIKTFQMRLGLFRSDGLVEPDRRTWHALANIKGTAKTADANDPRLSGAKWWYTHEAQYPNSSSLESLDASFRDKAKTFVSALRDAGATVRISATRRNATRAKLMHYSWTVMHGQTAPADVPALADCDIIWDHGDLARSKAAAAEMVRLFHIAFKPSLTSNHVRGTAIDMTITRPAKFSMADASGRTVGADSAASLNAVGASYGVHKLATDPPHWSADGH